MKRRFILRIAVKTYDDEFWAQTPISFCIQNAITKEFLEFAKGEQDTTGIWRCGRFTDEYRLTEEYKYLFHSYDD